MLINSANRKIVYITFDSISLMKEINSDFVNV